MSQPGDCSGIRIDSLYTKDLRSFKLHDKSLKVRKFIMQGQNTVCEIYETGSYSYHSLSGRHNADRRLLISYGGDTMMVDFVGFRSTYFCDHIDSLFLLPGHFIFLREQARPGKMTRDSIDRLMKRGLTSSALGILQKAELITHKKKIDYSFLNERSLPASFLLNRAMALITDSNYDSALADINNAIINNGGIKNCETRLLLCDALMGKGKYPEALTELNRAQSCDLEDWNLQNFYLKRIDVYTGLKRYNDAIADYDTLINSSERENLFTYSVDGLYLYKMLYRIRYIKDDKAIIAELEDVCASGKYGYYTGQLYFELAELQFRHNQKKIAYQNWVTAFEKMGFNHQKYESYALFDSLVKKDPKNPKLYYLRALTSPAVCYGPYGATLEGINAALHDFDMVEKLGMKPTMFDRFKIYLLDIKENTLRAEQRKAANGKQ